MSNVRTGDERRRARRRIVGQARTAARRAAQAAARAARRDDGATDALRSSGRRLLELADDLDRAEGRTDA